MDRVANFRKLPRGDESLSLDRNWAHTTAEFALRKALPERDPLRDSARCCSMEEIDVSCCEQTT